MTLDINTFTIKSPTGNVDIYPQNTTQYPGARINFHHAGVSNATAFIKEDASGVLQLHENPSDDSDDTTIATTHFVRLHGSGGGGEQCIFKTTGTISAETHTIPLPTQLRDISQVIYVNLDMGVVLPDEYTLSVSGRALDFVEPILAGTNYCVVYSTSTADIRGGILPQIYSISSTTATETYTLELGTQVEKDKILTVNVGNTVLLPDTYTVEDDALILQNPVAAGINWNVRYVKLTVADTYPMRVVKTMPVEPDPNTIYFIVPTLPDE